MNNTIAAIERIPENVIFVTPGRGKTGTAKNGVMRYLFSDDFGTDGFAQFKKLMRPVWDGFATEDEDISFDDWVLNVCWKSFNRILATKPHAADEDGLFDVYETTYNNGEDSIFFVNWDHFYRTMHGNVTLQGLLNKIAKISN